MKFTLQLILAGTLLVGISHADVIALPGGSLTIPALDSSLTTFTYTGTLTEADTISFVAGGDPTDPCLQSPASYCTNAAGVVTLAGSSPVGDATTFSGTFNGTTATWDFGALIMTISGEGAVQVFPTDTANGLLSSTPPTTLTLSSTTLASLGFGSFSLTDPTIGFILADFNFPDNSGAFVLTQPATGVPEPGTVGLIGLGLLAGAVWKRRARRG